MMCRAFPKGIPQEYKDNDRHDKVDPRQNNDVVFEPVDKWKHLYEE